MSADPITAIAAAISRALTARAGAQDVLALLRLTPGEAELLIAGEGGVVAGANVSKGKP